jgi:hypothetical protein
MAPVCSAFRQRLERRNEGSRDSHAGKLKRKREWNAGPWPDRDRRRIFHPMRLMKNAGFELIRDRFYTGAVFLYNHLDYRLDVSIEPMNDRTWSVYHDPNQTST